MEENHHQENKLKRQKRRNFVAKNNRNRGKRHASLKDYTRKPKYRVPYTDAWRYLRDTLFCLIYLLSCHHIYISSD